MNTVLQRDASQTEANEVGRILVVDDETTDRETVQRYLPRNFTLDEARSAREGREAIERCTYACILLDLGLPDADGIDQIAALDAAAPVVVLTGQGDQRAAVEAMKRGAADFLVKDLLDRAGLARAIEGAIEKRRLELLIEDQNRRLLQDERLKVLMQLAGSTLHEIFEPLTQLGLYLEGLARSTGLPEREARYAQGGYQAYADISATMRRVQLMHLEDGAEDFHVPQRSDAEGGDVTVLMAGDEPEGFDGFRSLLHDAGIAVESEKFRRCRSVEETRLALDDWIPTLLLATSEFPDGSLRDVVRETRSRQEVVPVLAMLPHNAGAMAAELVRDGATEYLMDTDWIPEKLTEAISRCVERAALSRELRESRERLHRMAFTDELTGLYNRRFLTESFERENDRVSRQRKNGAFCLLDIDHFKQVNDTHGHLVGDDVLRGTAEVLRGAIRKTDLVARYGGEEFAIILTDVDPGNVTGVVDQIREKLAAESFQSHGIELSVTASIGVALFGSGVDLDRTISDIVAEADQALYRAKESGRNRVCVSAAGAPAAADR